MSERFIVYVHIKFELSSTPICIWLFFLRGLMGQLGSECRMCFESVVYHFLPCPPGIRPSKWRTSDKNYTESVGKSHTEETKCNLKKKKVLVKALACSKSALREHWQAFRFSLSSTDVTKRRNGAGCSTFEDSFCVFAFCLRACLSLLNSALICLWRLIWFMSATSKYICFPFTRSTSLCREEDAL